ncbi:hypothetical protein AB1Y20_000359 [Prymnesium parvum]|uniref:Fanconi Anaemia group E protein C-terminal domain-containing protein n=1 Tax=Prymnesium parvum TaxID=97485 RepID=A0AB34K553_PRYPA
MASLWADEANEVAAHSLQRLRQALLRDRPTPAALLLAPFIPPCAAPAVPSKDDKSRKRKADDCSDAREAGSLPLRPAEDRPTHPTSPSSASSAVPDIATRPKVDEGIASPRAPQGSLASEVVAILSGAKASFHDAELDDETRAALCERAVLTLLSLEPSRVAEGCQLLQLDEAPVEALLSLCRAMASSDCSAQLAASVTSCVLLPRVIRVDEPASRSLFQSLLALQSLHPRVLVQSLMLPMLQRGAALNEPQTELLSQLIKQLHAPQLITLVVELLLQHADANVDLLSKSLKFSHVMFTLVNQYNAELVKHIPLVRRTVDKLETFMKRSALSVIDRLEKREATIRE